MVKLLTIAVLIVFTNISAYAEVGSLLIPHDKAIMDESGKIEDGNENQFLLSDRSSCLSSCITIDNLCLLGCVGNNKNGICVYECEKEYEECKRRCNTLRN